MLNKKGVFLIKICGFSFSYKISRLKTMEPMFLHGNNWGSLWGSFAQAELFSSALWTSAFPSSFFFFPALKSTSTFLAKGSSSQIEGQGKGSLVWC